MKNYILFLFLGIFVFINYPMQHVSLYDLLHVQSDATPEQIKNNYESLSSHYKKRNPVWHEKLSEEEVACQYYSVQYAYGVLSNTLMRQLYTRCGPERVSAVYYDISFRKKYLQEAIDQNKDNLTLLKKYALEVKQFYDEQFLYVCNIPLGDEMQQLLKSISQFLLPCKDYRNFVIPNSFHVENAIGRVNTHDCPFIQSHEKTRKQHQSFKSYAYTKIMKKINRVNDALSNCNAQTIAQCLVCYKNLNKYIKALSAHKELKDIELSILKQYYQCASYFLQRLSNERALTIIQASLGFTWNNAPKSLYPQLLVLKDVVIKGILRDKLEEVTQNCADDFETLQKVRDIINNYLPLLENPESCKLYQISIINSYWAIIQSMAKNYGNVWVLDVIEEALIIVEKFNSTYKRAEFLKLKATHKITNLGENSKT